MTLVYFFKVSHFCEAFPLIIENHLRHTIQIFLQPGLPVSPFLIRDAGDETVYKPLGEGLPTSVTLKLIGFTKSAALLNLPSADLLHAVKPQG